MQAASASPGGTLFVVATPIGNLADLSPRALATLKAVAAICAEDTRHTRQLLAHYGVEKALVALHEHNEGEIADKLVARLVSGESLALVSDAGTPLVSDPGYRLVRAARAAGVKVSPIPGASAVIAWPATASCSRASCRRRRRRDASAWRGWPRSCAHWCSTNPRTASRTPLRT